MKTTEDTPRGGGYLVEIEKMPANFSSRGLL